MKTALAGLFAVTLLGAAAPASALNVTITVMHTAPGPEPVITCPDMSVEDSAPKGVVVGTCTLSESDGSTFTGGTLTIQEQTPPGIFAVVSRTIDTRNIVIDPDGPGINQGPATDTVVLVLTQP